MAILLLGLGLLLPQDAPPAPASPVGPTTATAPAAVASPAAEPPRIRWQRTLDDALMVQKATGKPLLLCVNQDGEPFCERFAEHTYADPAFVAMTESYVCLIASPDVHTTRDYDGRGRRVECPRFPGVTCSEHQNVEPLLFARWFRGERYAPRHVGVALDGTVLFDRYLDSSMQTAVDSVAEHRKSAVAVPLRSELAARFDSRTHEALERAFASADVEGRLALLQRAGANGTAPIDALRMALRDDDPAVFAAGARTLAATAGPSAAIDLHDALARCDDEALAAQLEGTLVRVVEGNAALVREAAHRLAARRGFLASDPLLSFARDGKADPFDADDRDAIEAALDAAIAERRQNPGDAGAVVREALGHATLALHLLPHGHATVPLLLEDAERTAKAVPKDATTGQDAARHAVLAITSWQRGDTGAAAEAAERAAQSAKKAGSLSLPRAVALEWLRVLGRSQAKTVYDLEADKTHQAAVERSAHAFAQVWAERDRVEDALEYAALLAFANARREAATVLTTARQRFPASTDVHAALRARLLADRGARALVRDYAAWADTAEDRATADWFCGYAALVAAEVEVTDRESQDAVRAYSAAIARFAASRQQNADFADSADHYAVLALAGRALEHHLAGDDEGAVADLVAARALRPASMDQTDGLSRKPEAVLRRVQKALVERGKPELAARLD